MQNENKFHDIDIQEQLFYAVQKFDLSLIRELVAKGADINFLFNCTEFIMCSTKFGKRLSIQSKRILIV